MGGLKRHPNLFGERRGNSEKMTVPEKSNKTVVGDIIVMPNVVQSKGDSTTIGNTIENRQEHHRRKNDLKW